MDSQAGKQQQQDAAGAAVQQLTCDPIQLAIFSHRCVWV
jgi:hypothetical protein